MAAKRRGSAPESPVVGWVYLDRHRAEVFTVRWKRGDSVAYVLSGKRLGDHSMTDVMATIPVLPTGWTDLAQIRDLGMRWVRAQAART
ncbi:MAG: hypothetical protein ACRDSZ_01175 [Pseudonocardiaceae bacterium]